MYLLKETTVYPTKFSCLLRSNLGLATNTTTDQRPTQPIYSGFAPAEDDYNSQSTADLHRPKTLEASLLDNLPSGVDCFYGGDVNAHSRLWDLHQPQDSRGDRIEEWKADNDLVCANDGTPTRINRGTTGESSPDTFLVLTRWRSRTEWTVGECLGSDHLPMVITLRCRVGLFPQAPKPARWKTKNVNWNAFNDALESEVALWEILPTIRASAKRFTEAITEVGKAHVGKTKPGKRKKIGLSPRVRLLVKKRNNLRKLVHTRREEWVAACGEVASAVEQEKEKSWTEFVETLEKQNDYAKTWQVLGAISGSPDSCSPNEAIRVGDKILTSNPSKADGFTAHYAKVSKISFSAEERSRIRLAKRTVNSPSADDSTTADFSIINLNRALKKIKNRGAAGPDENPPTFLKNLGNHAKTELLRVFNMSCRSERELSPKSGVMRSSSRCSSLASLLVVSSLTG